MGGSLRQTPGSNAGRARTFDEFSDMAREAGLEVKAVGRQPTGRTIVECVCSNRE